MTLTNPATILWFLGIFAGLGLAATSSDYGAASLLVLGVFSGSALWWVLLSGGVGLLRMRLTPDAMRWINRVSGAVLVVFGALALVSIAT